YTEKGNLINSGEFNGIDNESAKSKITEFLEKKKLGRKVVQFKLRDWLISRQRYWGTPIPVIYCDKCGVVAVNEKDLPVKLPKDVKFGEGNPLLTNEKWIKTKCPKCGNVNARRETDTMDTFVNSSWYFLRYCDPENNKEIFDKKKIKYWMPIDQYIGGAEHACMHLIYFRFYTKFLRDLGLLEFDEPAKKLFHQGMLHGSDGEKMSKSRGNTVDPIDTIKKYSADSLRLALMSFASPDSDTNWDEKVLAGSHKFLTRVYVYYKNVKISKKENPKIESKLNKIIKEVTNQIENFKYNLAIIKIRELFSVLFSENEVSKEVLENSLKLLHPFCPHITEELYEKIGNKNFISLSSWPIVEEKKIDETFDKQEEAVEKLVSDVVNIIKIVEQREGAGKKNKVYVYVVPNEKSLYTSEEISKRVGKEVLIYAVNDSKKYDPNNISKKTKPNRPAIYLE
ncbi:class I tRNA ligase family protein, partial [Candidatus Pacearchaeota archaeon]|nr:class I tRNA ligase family protein [Candidatus Pacearchaeota archaeon]